MRSIMALNTYIIAFLLLTVPLWAQVYIVPDLERDDFKNLKSWWSVNYSPPSGYNHSMTFNNGYLKANLVEPLNGGIGGPLQPDMIGMENVGISTASLSPIYDKHQRLDLTIRVKTLNVLPVGSRGWGFWKSEGIPITINQATWFMEQHANPDSSWAPQETWWQARTLDGVDNTYDFSTDISTYDNQLWHVYKVRRYSESAIDGYYEHYIDGTLIQRIVPSDFPDGSIINEDFTFNCWNDNLVYQFIEGGISPDSIAVTYNGWLGTSSFVVDFIEIRKNGYDPSYSVTPTGSGDVRRLREYPDEIDDGISNGLWKSYPFDLYAEKAVIIATAKAEEYDGYDNDDDLKLVIDSHDYGFNSAKSWDGLSDQSMPKTIVIDTTMPTGSHQIDFYSEVTPILYDANVLSSTDGILVLDTLVNASAPSGSVNLEWKNFSFSCAAGPVAVYLSGSADEEPGWNHINADIDSSDDDELRIMIDNTDYGWATANALEGNSLYGDVKTILIMDTLTAGSHSVKLYTRETPTVYRVLAFAANGDYALPVALSGFSVRRVPGGNELEWSTQSEVNNLGFNIYRAATADSVAPEQASYRKLNTMLIAGAGNTSTENHYSFTDGSPISTAFSWYVLEDVDYSGQRIRHAPLAINMASLAPVDDYRLFQNYPNPFNPKTAINYELRIRNDIQLTVYNSLGQKVATLISGEQSAGSHQIVWDASGFASGVYFYKLSVGRAVQIRKMLLLR